MPVTAGEARPDQTQEVIDVDSNPMTSTPAAGLSVWVATAHSSFTAPKTREHGTGLPFAGYAAAVPAARPAAQVAVLGARVIDLPGSPPRGAPV